MSSPIIVFEASEAWRRPLIARLSATVGAADADALRSALPDEPVIVVLGPSASLEPTLDGAAAVLADHDGVRGILLASEATPDVIGAAIEVGIRDVLPSTSDLPDIIAAVDRLTSTAPTRPADDGSLVQPRGTAAGPIVAVFSGKGGSGASVISANLAVALARRSQRNAADVEPTVLVDLDLQFGDAALLLRVTPRATLVDAISLLASDDPQLLLNALARHAPSGVLVLPPPTEPSQSPDIDRRDVVDVLGLVRRGAAATVVDMASHLDGVSLSALGVADHIVVVTDTDVPSLKATSTVLRQLRLAAIDLDRVTFVVSGARVKHRLDLSAVTQALGVEVDVIVPHAPEVWESVNDGEPVILRDPRARFSRSIDDLADLVAESR